MTARPSQVGCRNHWRQLYKDRLGYGKMSSVKGRDKQRLTGRSSFHWMLLRIAVAIVLCACNQNEEPPELSQMGGELPEVNLGQTADDLEVLPLPHVTPVELPPLSPDFLLATTLRMRFEADELTRGRFIRIDVTAGVVWLRGEINSGEAAARAEAIAVASEGVQAVHNELVSPPITPEALALVSQVPEEVLSVQPLFANGSTIADPDTNPAPTYEVEPPIEQPPPNVAEEVSEADTEPDSFESGGDEPNTDIVEPAEPVHTYTVHPGDSLWGIASSEMGSGHRWEELYDANRDVIGDDPMNLRAGIVLRIP